MGLDMYLDVVKEGKDLTIEEIRDRLYGFEDENTSLLETENVSYWRKVNAIHKWFVENVQDGVDDCEPYIVSQENVEDLIHTINKVLSLAKVNSSEQSEKIEELLPTSSGFFFGSTEYDDYYFEELERTKSILDNLLDGLKMGHYDGDVLIYTASW